MRGCLTGPLRWAFYRFTPFGRVLMAAEIVMSARRYYRALEPVERRELTRIVRKSRGLPTRVSAAERAELRRLVAKLDASRLLTLAVQAWRPWGRGRSPR